MKIVILISFMALIAYGNTIAQTTHTITDNDNGFAFDPAELTINVGDTVAFEGSDLHPV